ncbi:Csu type fimbrial protein [Photobacterium ganghwense]|nr:spore coat U domain-containing protein [Photobacterium ganghwense]
MKISHAVSIIALFVFSAPMVTASSDSFKVTATIDTGCLVNGSVSGSSTTVGQMGALDFGRVATLSATQLESTVTYNSSLMLSCTPGVAMNVALNGGLYQEDGLRQMKHVSEDAKVTYLLFQDLARTTIFDIDVLYPVNTTDSPNDIQVPIWGLATITGNETTGFYSDTFTLTLEW